jgi:hypothetical protein
MSLSHLKSGAKVSVRSPSQIAATLDQEGTLDGLPFMPEMLQFCGRSFVVANRIDKTCVEGAGVRRFAANDVVTLEGLRCDGQSHGGCRTACLVFWKAAWLTVQPPPGAAGRPEEQAELMPRLKTRDASGSFRCQASRLRDATIPISLPRLVVLVAKDLASGRIAPRVLGRVLAPSLYWRTIGPCLRLVRRAKRVILGTKLPTSPLARKTPAVCLGLQPGDLVRVKTREEIAATLDSRGKNRGLKFTDFMSSYCGGTFRVLVRLDKMILETSGELKDIQNTVLLENVTCNGFVCWGLCPRKQYHFWREAWLERVDRAKDQPLDNACPKPSR